jgi:D-alanyl-D-alanine-carboxypeptidase/D-alanyl-D-alanine-endopeptidase
LTFLAAQLGYVDTPLASVMKYVVDTRRLTGDSRAKEIGLGWLVYSRQGGEIIGHGGETAGFQSAIAFDPKARAGVVVLSNTSAFRDIADISMHLLDPGYSLERPSPVEISLQPGLFDRYVGRYELEGEPKLVLTMSREEGRFFVQAEGQGKLELFSENSLEFFLKVTDARITFEIDAEGKTTGLILHQNGQDERGRRVE